jgi:hypothetical protein
MDRCVRNPFLDWLFQLGIRKSWGISWAWKLTPIWVANIMLARVANLLAQLLARWRQNESVKWKNGVWEPSSVGSLKLYPLLETKWRESRESDWLNPTPTS